MWIFTENRIFKLPQDENAADARRRAEELTALREEYGFAADPVGPPGIKKMPREEDLTFQRKFSLYWDLGDTIVDLGLADVEELLEPGVKGTLRAYDALYPLRPSPSVRQRWRTDEEFGRQRLVATNPLMIRRCVTLPPFPLEAAALRRLVGRETTLEGLLAQDRLYGVDYAIYQGIPPKPGHVLSDPYALFYRNDAGRLMPLAIQLQQQAAGPVFTPLDPPNLWLLVKMWFQNADGMYSELASHLLRTHLVSETFWIAARRQLSPRHPLLELLTPHFRSTIAINWHARTQLLAPGGPVDNCFSTGYEGSLALIRKAWEAWTFDACDPEMDFRARGFDDALELPDYYYREDVRKIWKALRSFVGAVVGTFYRADDDVRRDGELQAWMGDLVDAGVRGLPLSDARHVESLADLVWILAQTIFTASAEHASINNGQYDYFGYLPNGPGCLVKRPPTTHDEITEDDVASYLPDLVTAGQQIAIAHMLSKAPTGLLGHYDEDFFASVPSIAREVALFQSDLNAISSQIQRRNLLLDVPYPYLDPRRIGRSVEI